VLIDTSLPAATRATRHTLERLDAAIALNGGVTREEARLAASRGYASEVGPAA
jgi:hypothetical protein